MTTAGTHTFSSTRLGVIVAITLVTTVLALLAVAWLPLVGAGQRSDFVALAVGRPTSAPDRSVQLVVRIQNTSPDSISGTLRVTGPAAPTRPGAILWSADVTAAAGETETATIEVPQACGERLAIVLDAATVTRSVSIRVPCEPSGLLP